MRVLVTRPEPDGTRTAALLRARGHEVILAPMLAVESVVANDFGSESWAAILMTSANAARSAPVQPNVAMLKLVPVLAVGAATAAAARAAGFAHVESAEGDGGDLRDLAMARIAPGGRVLYLAGAERARDLSADLAGAGLSVTTAVVYRTRPATALPHDAEAALRGGTIDAVLHFSRRSVESFLGCVTLMREAALDPLHIGLSERALEPLRRAGATRVRVAPRPDEESLLQCLTQQPL